MICPISHALCPVRWPVVCRCSPPFLKWLCICLSPTCWQGQKTFSEAWRGRVHTNLLRNDTLPEWNLTLNELTFSSFPEEWLSPESGQGCLGPCLMLCSLPKLGEDLSNHRCHPVPTKSTRWARILLEASTAMPTFL